MTARGGVGREGGKQAMLDNLKESPEQVAGWFGRGRRFIAEARGELSRVTWPTRREVWATTIVVILVSTAIGLYLFACDLVLSSLMDWIFRRFGAA